MQSFVPYPDFQESAAVLDSRRLAKQLLEGRQVYNIISGQATTNGWRRHPAVLMWKNFDNAFFEYLVAIKNECVDRGINTLKNWQAILDMHEKNWDRGDGVVMPFWWEDERVHQSHRNNLYRKDPEYYGQFSQEKFISCCDRCNYFWPTHIVQYNLEAETV